jgi:hypothetical protein
VRTIKFKAWNDIDKMMIGWDTLQASPVLLMNILKGKVKHHKLMQFTGLQDSEGVDIYEGDVFLPLYNRLPKLAVIYKNGKFNISNFCHAKCKVIGNIHQNPELLGLNK